VDGLSGPGSLVIGYYDGDARYASEWEFGNVGVATLEIGQEFRLASR